MKDGIFKNLVEETFAIARKGSLIGILYSATQTYNFSKLINFEEFIYSVQIDMCYLKSNINNKEVDIYEWELEDYSVDKIKHAIYVKLKNKQEYSLLY